MGFIDRRMRKQRKRNENTAELFESANDAMGEVGKFGANLKTMGAFSKRGPLNKYEDPAFVGQADLNSHILEKFSEGIMEKEEKEENKGIPVEKRGCRSYLKKEYRGKSNSYEGFQKKGLLNKVESGPFDERERSNVFDDTNTDAMSGEKDLYNKNSKLDQEGRYSEQAEEWIKKSKKGIFR